MEIEEIRRRLDVLSEIAKSRRLGCDGIFSSTVGGADIDFMTPEEREERHQLTLLLPTSAEDREAAKTRIQQRIKQRKALSNDRLNRDRLFSGVYPCGIVYADRYREKGGDYARLAFLAYDTLQLRVEDDCPVELRALIETDAAAIQAKRGQPYQVSTSGQTVMLGSKASI